VASRRRAPEYRRMPIVGTTSGQRGDNGFSFIELVIVICIIAVLFVAAATRIWGFRVDAERVALETVVGAINSALGIKVAEYIVRNKVAKLAQLEMSNPMGQLAQIPKNYLGELGEMQAAAAENGNWYFDSASHYLIYRVKNAANLKTSLPPPARARFVIQLVYDDVNANGIFDPGKDVITGLRLVPVEPYVWID